MCLLNALFEEDVDQLITQYLVRILEIIFKRPSDANVTFYSFLIIHLGACPVYCSLKYTLWWNTFFWFSSNNT